MQKDVKLHRAFLLIKKEESFYWEHDGHNDYDRCGEIKWEYTSKDKNKTIVRASYDLGRNGSEDDGLRQEVPTFLNTKREIYDFIKEYKINDSEPYICEEIEESLFGGWNYNEI